MTKKLRGQSATIEMEDSDGVAIAVGTLDNPFVSVPQDVQELRGTGSTEWVDLQKTESAVTIGGDVMTFDLDAWDRLVDWDEAAGELDDSAEVATFEVTVTYTAADGSTKEITAGPGYRNNDLELGGSREEWIGMSLEFRCQTIIDITNTDASA